MRDILRSKHEKAISVLVHVEVSRKMKSCLHMVKTYNLKTPVLLVSGAFVVFGVIFWLGFSGSGQNPKAVLHCQGSVSRIAFSPDSRNLVVGCRWDHVVEMWDVSSSRKTVTFQVPPIFGGCSSVAFSPDGKYVAAGGSEMIKYWDVATLKEKSKDQWHRLHVMALCFTPLVRRAVFRRRAGRGLAARHGYGETTSYA